MLGWSKLKHERFTVQVWQEWHGTKSVPSILTVLIDAYWCNIYSTISLQVFRCSITSPAHRYQHGLIRRHKRLPFLSHYEVFRNHWVFQRSCYHCKPNERTPQATKLGLRKSLPVSPIKCNFNFSQNLNALQYPLPSAPPISIAFAPISLALKIALTIPACPVSSKAFSRSMKSKTCKFWAAQNGHHGSTVWRVGQLQHHA